MEFIEAEGHKNFVLKVRELVNKKLFLRLLWEQVNEWKAVAGRENRGCGSRNVKGEIGKRSVVLGHVPREGGRRELERSKRKGGRAEERGRAKSEEGRREEKWYVAW